jgi:hypothetical protein
MTLRDPQLAFTALLAPVRRFSTTPPPWPAVVADLFALNPNEAVDPVAAVLHGPIARRRLAVGSGKGDLRAHLIGLGDSVAVSVIARHRGELDRAPRERLQAAAAGVLVHGFPDSDGKTPAPVEVVPELLAERLGSDPGWQLLGFCEVLTVLVEGIAGDLPVGGAWAETGAVHIGRARGVGAAHVAWEARGHFASGSQQDVVSRRLETLRDGYAAKIPPTIEFAAAALRWEHSARRALGLAGALDDLIDTVRAAASWAVTGAPPPGEGTPELVNLSARLETLRVGLAEELETLRGLRPRLAGSVERVFGGAGPPHGGPFAEGGEDGARVIEALAGREASAARWSAMLEVARRAETAS